MKLSSLHRSLLTLSALVGFAFWPQAALAQHGGGGFHGGGGGGFHGGGGSFHGGASFSGAHSSYSAPRPYGGGYHAGAYYGHTGYYGHRWYGGYHGWYGGRYWGYPYYGWGWGFAWGWPYWGWGYPSAYWGYPTYSYSYPASPPDPNTNPSNYPYQCPPGYSCIQDQPDPPPGAPPVDNPPASGAARPTPSAYPRGNPKPWRTPSTAPSPQISTPSTRDLPPVKESYNLTPGRVLSVDQMAPDAIVATPATYRRTPAGNPAYGPLRPEIVRAMQQLHEMPPKVREREIATGRYSHFSAPEKQILRSVR